MRKNVQSRKVVRKKKKKEKEKEKKVRWDFQGLISSGYLAHCSHSFFMCIRIEFSASYSILSQSLVSPISLARLFINSSSVNVLWGDHANYSYFDTCSNLHTSAASACNWAGYHSFSVMVLKCTHYTTRITLNVSQTGCTVASQLGLELGSLVWLASFLPIKPSKLASIKKKSGVWKNFPNRKNSTKFDLSNRINWRKVE